MEHIEEDELGVICQNKKMRIQQHFQARLKMMQTVADAHDVKSLAAELKVYHEKMDIRADGPFEVSTDAYRQITGRGSDFLMTFWKRSGFQDVLLICADHGHMMMTTAQESDLGTNLKYGRYKESGLARLWEKIRATGKPSIIDFTPYAPSNNEPAAFIGIPGHDDSGKLDYILAFQLSIDPINEIMQEKNGLGSTRESFLVGPDKLMRSDLNMDLAHHSIKASFDDPVLGKMETLATAEALAGKSGEGIITASRY